MERRKATTAMKQIRIGKDISLRWEITTDGEAIPLEGRDLTVELKSPIGKVSNMPFRVDGNVLIMTYYGYEQTLYGEYSLTLWENIGKPGQNVVDAISAFKLVRTSQEEDDFIGGELQVECVDLGTANLEILLGSATPGESPDMSALKSKVDANTTRISAVENKNTEQDSRLNNIESRLDSDIAGATSAASEALTAAQKAQTAASTASENAGHAIGIANEANEKAKRIEGKADDALTKATEATGKADAAERTATEAKRAADSAAGKADAAQKAAENEATSRTEADIALQSQINGKQDNIGSFSTDEKADFIVSLGLGKIGIVSQKQTWNDVGVEPAYVMSEKVEGFISKDNIDSLISYGFAFNEGTGYFELNGLTDISLQEALNIVAAGKPNYSMCDLHYAGKKIRTNLPILNKGVSYGRYFGNGSSIGIRMSNVAISSDIEVFAYTDKMYNKDDFGFLYSKVSMANLAFAQCYKLEKIYIIPGTAGDFFLSFDRCVRLKELDLVYLICDVNLAVSSYLSAKSTHIMIAKANNNKAITITLHPDAKARWEASEYYEEDSQTIISKNITIA